jgi:hypothetical protein
MAEEERQKRAYVRRAPLRTPEFGRARQAEFASLLPAPIERPEPSGTSARKPTSISDIRTDDELQAETARNNSHADLVSSYEAGTLKQTHPFHATVPFNPAFTKKISESDTNYNKRLGTLADGAVWARALALPSTLISQHGVHFDQRDFHKHWGAPASHVVAAVKRKPGVGVGPVTNDDFTRISSQFEADNSASSNSWEDTDGTATGDAS